MKIIPGSASVTIDNALIRSVESVELVSSPNSSSRQDIYAIVTIKLNYANTSKEKIELSTAIVSR